jgi:membrane-associated protease RseP (regulator of RpoE activity)
MLGVTVGEFNAEIAADLGVPVTEAIRLDGVIEDMGAAAAGLRKDDVIVGIGGVEVTTWPTLSNALQPHHAGDRVEVVFYRGAEKKRVTMELSPRPLPDVPPAPEDLAAAVRQSYEELDAELTTFIAGLSEETASYRPAPDEWNVKETLAHLIVGERGFQGWLADLINDDEPMYDRWENPTTVPARLKATLEAYPTLPALLEELKRSEAETLAMLGALPPEFVARQGSYTRLGYNLLELPGFHTRQHLDQMRQAVAAEQSQ